AKRIFFIAHSPCLTPFCRRPEPTWRGPKDFSDPTRELVTAQIVWLRQALIWPHRRVTCLFFIAHLAPLARGFFYACAGACLICRQCRWATGSRGRLRCAAATMRCSEPGT